jgi:spermidine/putrescine transport system permease protein
MTTAQNKRLSHIAQYTYLSLVMLFVAAPMLVIIVFSFDANRFPSIPWGGFSLVWHKAILEDGMVREAFRNSVIVGMGTAIISTLIGFAAAYLDFRYTFLGKRTFTGCHPASCSNDDIGHGHAGIAVTRRHVWQA